MVISSLGLAQALLLPAEDDTNVSCCLAQCCGGCKFALRWNARCCAASQPISRICQLVDTTLECCPSTLGSVASWVACGCCNAVSMYPSFAPPECCSTILGSVASWVACECCNAVSMYPSFAPPECCPSTLGSVASWVACECCNTVSMYPSFAPPHGIVVEWWDIRLDTHNWSRKAPPGHYTTISNSQSKLLAGELNRYSSTKLGTDFCRLLLF